MKIFSYPKDPIPMSELTTHLLELEKFCFRESAWSYSQIHSHLTIHSAVLSTDGEIPIGYCLYTENNWEIEILRMGVYTIYQNRGIGKSLINFLVNQASCKDIYLEVDELNHTAIRLYQKLDFQLLDKRKAYYQNGNDALLYKKKNSRTYENHT